jgi:hypothetical protein
VKGVARRAMNPLVKALEKTIKFLEKQNIDYMVIGAQKKTCSVSVRESPAWKI